MVPVQLWGKMLKQVQDTLNMFRTSRNNTTKTAYQELEGNFDWNATPMAPLGIKGSVFTHTHTHKHAHTHTRTHTHTHTHTHTQGHRNTDTQTRRHTDTHIYGHTDTQTHPC